MENKERVLLAACLIKGKNEDQFETSVQELHELTNTAKGHVVKTVTQKRSRIHPAIYFGEGKIEEIKADVDALNIDVVVFNDELSPGQLKNLTDHLQVRVIDRTQLILDIFAQRANTREGKLQVELAQMQYLLTRLHGKGAELSRLGGGIGTRGPGETKLETDRRHIQRRITEIKRHLANVVNQRGHYRKRRKDNQVFQIALVGYTNSGKSTIFNRLTSSETLEEDQLFATLDPLTRQIQLPGGFSAIISDTVGFIQDLPTTLVAAFRSTLEEVSEADFILHVVDGSNPNYHQHEKTVNQLLRELNADQIPTLTVYNKEDKMIDFVPNSYPFIKISALNEHDIDRLQTEIEKVIQTQWKYYQKKVNPDEGRLLNQLQNETIVIGQTFDEHENTFVLEGYVNPNHPVYQFIHEKEQ
ncbi:GTPase HflX [Salirhabdus salicampi]|uniref:GTPase HflX n=1 Tax=Salirhabdus salicampi TaxID=476102 RepID=UPI0020C49916|nr:GTPase HflX [Salirhabdus salicampi]MCP8616435.1 GTPase HflX [Salirhabdus salicampi]